MVSMRPLLSITMAEPSRSRPGSWSLRPSGLMKVFMRTTPESSSASAGDWARATEAGAGGEYKQRDQEARSAIHADFESA